MRRNGHRAHLSESEAATNFFQLEDGGADTWHRRSKSSADEMPRPRAYRRHRGMGDVDVDVVVLKEEDDHDLLDVPRAVKKSDELRRIATLRFTFSRWKGYTVRVKSRLRLLTRQAEDFDRDILARDALFLWHARVEEHRIPMLKAEAANNLLLKERVFHKWLDRWEGCMRDVDEYVCERVRLAAWRGWRRRMLHDDGKIEHWKLGRTVDKWKAKARMNQEREQQVQVLHARALCRLYLIAWKIHLDQNNAVLIHDKSVINKAWRSWRVRVRNVAVRNERAELLLESNLMYRCVPKWVSKTRACVELEDMAVVHYGLATQGWVLRTWRMANVLKQKFRGYTTKKAIPIQRVFLQRWNDYYFENGVADNCRYRVIAKRYLRIWHKEFEERQWTAQVTSNFLTAYFTKWTHETTLKQFKETLAISLLRRTLRCWLSRTVELEEIDEQAKNAYVQHVRPRQLRSWLYGMRERFLLHLQMEQKAINHDELIVLANRTSQWRSSTSKTQQLVKDKNLVADNHFTSLMFIRWHTFLLAKQETQRQSTLKHFVDTQRKRKLIQCYNLWHKIMVSRKRLEYRANELFNSIKQEYALTCVSHWRHRTAELHDRQVDATAFSCKMMLQRYLNFIRVVRNDIVELQMIAEEESTARDQASHAQLIRSWRMRLFKIRGFDIQAQLFKERSKGLLIRDYYRDWRAKTILKKAAPPLREDFEEGNTTADMVLSTPSKPPRAWSTSTPRSRIRGSAIRLGNY